MSKRPTSKRRVMVVTGSRSEFGLLRPVMEAVRKNKRLALQVVVAGEHLLAPASTWREVDEAFGIDARVPMQKKGDKGRADHAAACGRGVEGFARVIKKLKPDWVVVLGDRIEAFAAASAASIAGVAVCHIHGGDRAEGIADEAMRHAITKLSHLHCAATKLSAERIVKMGEPKGFVHISGSPAMDGLGSVKPLSAAASKEFGDANVIVLLHPSGLDRRGEYNTAVLVSSLAVCLGKPLFLAPNSDPGHPFIRRQWTFMKKHWSSPVFDHLPRSTFLSLIRRLSANPRGVILGNSSAALLECAALGLPAINVGVRQAGRETPVTVLSIPADGPDRWDSWFDGIVRACRRHVGAVHRRSLAKHPYGDGRAGPRIAALLAKTDPRDQALLRKRIAY